MTAYSYNTILTKAKNINNNVKNNYKLGEATGWSYYIAKAILSPKKSITKITVASAPKPMGSHISRQITRAEYLTCIRKFIKYVEEHNQLPNYITWGDLKISTLMYTYLFANILVYYSLNNVFPTKRNINTKVFTKPIETQNSVYKYFVQVFGSFGDTIDGALSKISGRGYGYYYDDTYSNQQSIDRMKKELGINCTDSCQVFYNIMLELIKKGKYKKVECLHVKCSGGDGHVRLRITLNDGTKIYRDPACTLKSGGTCNWCTSGYTLLDVDPSWFKENLLR